MKLRKNNTKILHVRNDVWVNVENIDAIVRTNKDPKDNKNLPDDIYVIYLKNSKYNWIAISVNDFNTLIKPYI